MPNKPTTVPVLDGNQSNRTIPAPSKVTDGYLLNDLLPADNANYLWGWAGDWLGWLDATFDDGDAAGDIRINGVVGLEDTPLTGNWVGHKLNVQWDADPADNLAAMSVSTDVLSLTATRTASGMQSRAYNRDTVNTYVTSWLGGFWSEVGVSDIGTATDADCFSGAVAVNDVAGDITGNACIFRAYDGVVNGTIAKLFGLRVDALTDGTANYGAWLGDCSPGYSLWVDGGAVELGSGLVTMTATGGTPWIGHKLRLNDRQTALPSNAPAFSFNAELTGLGAGTSYGAWSGGCVNTMSAGTASYNYAYWGECDANHTGSTVTNSDVFAGGVYKGGDATGLITNASVFRAYNDGSATAGITNQYGLRVENLTAGANNYGVYIVGASTYSLWVGSGLARFDGDVFIGDDYTTPDANLHVRSSADDAVIHLEADTSNSNENANAYLWMEQDGGTIWGEVGFVGAVDTSPGGKTVTGALNNALLIYDEDVSGSSFGAIQLGVENLVRLTIEQTGNVGIGPGFNNPETLLHLWQSEVRAPPGGVMMTLEKDDSLLISLLSSNSAGKIAGFWFGDADATALGRFEYHHDTNSMEWWTSNVRHMALMSTGALAIGTNFTTPDSLLHVYAGNAGTVTAATGTVACLEYSGNAYLSILTPVGNNGGLICGDPDNNDAGVFQYEHGISPPGWNWYVEGTQQMRLDLTNGLVVNDPVKATNYALSGSKVLQTSFLDAGVNTTSLASPVPTHVFRDDDNQFLSFYDSGLNTRAHKVLSLPTAGTVSQIRVRVRGGGSHAFSIYAYSKPRTDNLNTGAGIMANYSTAGLDISAAAGTWITLAVVDGSQNAADVVHITVYNNDNTQLDVEMAEVTMSALTDVSTNIL